MFIDKIKTFRLYFEGRISIVAKSIFLHCHLIFDSRKVTEAVWLDIPVKHEGESKLDIH
jgi:hypothetical protein